MRCARCRRKLTREPVMVAGRGLGPRCAELEGDLLTQPAKRVRVAPRRRAEPSDDRQGGLFA